VQVIFLKFTLIVLLGFFSIYINAQEFEGEIIYSVETSGYFMVEGNEIDLRNELIKSSASFDTMTFLYKGNSYIKTKNKKIKEEIYFSLTNKTSVLVVQNDEQIIVDDLSYLDLIENLSYPVGEIKNFSLSDTILSRFEFPCKYLVVEGEFGDEKFIFSDKMPKLSFSRNILLSEEYQNYPELIAKEIDKSILISYEVEIKNFSTKINLENYVYKNLDLNEFELPLFKEKRRDRKFNKISKRFKMYSLIQKK